jgi:hypothetical protein
MRRPLSLRLFRRPDAELSATMQQAHEVPHAVVVSIGAGWYFGLPQRFDEFGGALPVRRREARHRIRRNQCGGVGAAQRLTSSVYAFPYASIPCDSKKAWSLSLNSRSRGSPAYQDQSTDQFAAVRQASTPKLSFFPPLPGTGVPS